MSADSHKAVVDRFEGDKAVLEVDGRTQMIVLKSILPEETMEGHHLRITIQDEEIIGVVIDEEATRTARERISNKLDRLFRGEHLDDAEN